MAHLTAATVITLGVLEGHSTHSHSFFKCDIFICGTSRGPSVSAELLVNFQCTNTIILPVLLIFFLHFLFFLVVELLTRNLRIYQYLTDFHHVSPYGKILIVY